VSVRRVGGQEGARTGLGETGRGAAAGLLGQSRKWGEGRCWAAASGPREEEWAEGREGEWGREFGPRARKQRGREMRSSFFFFISKPYFKSVLKSV